MAQGQACHIWTSACINSSALLLYYIGQLVHIRTVPSDKVTDVEGSLPLQGLASDFSILFAAIGPSGHRRLKTLA